MKLIRLTQGQEAMVDDEDFERVNKHNWYALKTTYGYRAAREVKGGHVLMHRFIMNPKENEVVDHRNHITLDNQKHNLRNCTEQQNVHNRQKQKSKTTSIYKGVSWEKDRGKWISNINVDYERKYLGMFKDEFKAAVAYDVAARYYHEEFCCLNFPNDIIFNVKKEKVKFDKLTIDKTTKQEMQKEAQEQGMRTYVLLRKALEFYKKFKNKIKK